MDVPRRATASDSFFLPDFCAVGTLFTVVLVGQLLVFLLLLTSPGDDWLGELAMISLFVQWVALTSAGLLCATRRQLASLGDASAGIAAWLLVLTVTALVGEAAWWLVEQPSPGATRHLPFQLRNLAIGAIVSAAALRYLYVQQQWKRRIESEAQARFEALQARIRPHFLFNSMNTIASLARSRPDIAEEVVEDLADLFRASLGDASTPATLARELELCREYLRIEAQRLGERLRTDWQVDGLPGDALLPPLTLQPLVENAVYHGIEPAADGGELRIRGEKGENGIVITIDNPVATDAATSIRQGNHMAQRNVDERMKTFFGAGAGLELQTGAERYRVRLSFPYRNAQ